MIVVVLNYSIHIPKGATVVVAVMVRFIARSNEEEVSSVVMIAAG